MYGSEWEGERVTSLSTPNTSQQPELLELIESILVYKLPQMSRQEIERMFSMSDLRQTRVYQEALQEGIEQGIEQGRQEVAIGLLRMRFGTIDSELEAIAPIVTQLPTEEFTPLLLQLSREELIARFRGQTER